MDQLLLGDHSAGHYQLFLLGLTSRATSGTFQQPQSSTYIDEILLVAFPKVVEESSLAGVGIQKDKILHPDPVPGYQSPFHVGVAVLVHLFLLQHKGFGVQR